MVDGEPWLVYSGNLTDAEHQTVCHAAPRPGLERWSGEQQAVLKTAPEGAEVGAFRDPFVCRDGADYRTVVGAGDPDGTGAALFYRSEDLRSWTPLGPLCTAADPAFAAYDTGDVWECPQLLRRGDQQLLVLSAWRHNGGPDHALFVAGRLAGDRLVPLAVGRLDYGPDFYAPALMVDDAGRCVLWGWSWEARDPPMLAPTDWPAC